MDDFKKAERSNNENTHHYGYCLLGNEKSNYINEEGSLC